MSRVSIKDHHLGGRADHVKASMASEPPSGIFRFLALPAELRNTIYFEVLTPGPSRYQSCVHINRAPHFDYRWTSPAPLQACHQIREEALSIYYCHNNFYFDHPSMWPEDMVRWMTSVEEKNVLAMKNIYAQLRSTYASASALELLDRFYNGMEEAGFHVQNDASLNVHVQSYVYPGENICCEGGHCSYKGGYSVHQVGRKELKSLIALEVEAGVPYCLGWRAPTGYFQR